MLPATETYVEKTYIDALFEHGSLFVLSDAPPDEALVHKGVNIPAPPPRVKRIRSNGRDVITPVSAYRTKFTVHRQIRTPMPYLPTRVVGMAVGVFVTGVMTRLRSVMRNWAGSEYEQLVMRGPRADYYAGIAVEIDRLLQTSR